jgi:hypothetical protein
LCPGLTRERDLIITLYIILLEWMTFPWKGHPLENDYAWEPVENLYDHEDLVDTYQKWLKKIN